MKKTNMGSLANLLLYLHFLHQSIFQPIKIMERSMYAIIFQVNARDEALDADFVDIHGRVLDLLEILNLIVVSMLDGMFDLGLFLAPDGLRSWWVMCEPS